MIFQTMVRVLLSQDDMSTAVKKQLKEDGRVLLDSESVKQQLEDDGFISYIPKPDILIQVQVKDEWITGNYFQLLGDTVVIQLDTRKNNPANFTLTDDIPIRVFKRDPFLE